MSTEPERWCVFWNLEIVRVDAWDAQTLAHLDVPDAGNFRLSFSDRAAAVAFVGEIQRYAGGMISQLLHQGVKITTNVELTPKVRL